MPYFAPGLMEFGFPSVENRTLGTCHEQWRENYFKIWVLRLYSDTNLPSIDVPLPLPLLHHLHHLLPHHRRRLHRRCHRPPHLLRRHPSRHRVAQLHNTNKRTKCHRKYKQQELGACLNKTPSLIKQTKNTRMRCDYQYNESIASFQKQPITSKRSNWHGLVRNDCITQHFGTDSFFVPTRLSHPKR